MSAASGAGTEPEPLTDGKIQMPRVFNMPHPLRARALDARSSA